MSEEKKTKRTFSAKAVAILMVMVLLIGGAMGGTMAWLVAKTEPVVNTFTYGDINITLTENPGELDDGDGKDTTNKYEMIPGKIITKDPKVTVLPNSEKNGLFVKLVKSGGTATDNFDKYLTYAIADGWTKIDDGDGDAMTDLYYRIVDKSADKQEFKVILNDQVTVLDTVTKEMVNALDKAADGTELTTKTYPQLAITAYAVQYTAAEDINKTGDQNAADAWALVQQP